jgi:hypothetical protein
MPPMQQRANIEQNYRNNEQAPGLDQARLHLAAGYQPLTYQGLLDRVQQLFLAVPEIPKSKFVPGVATESHTEISSVDELHQWADQLIYIVDEYQLLLSCIGPVSYVWRNISSAESVTNLSILSSELVQGSLTMMIDLLSARSKASIAFLRYP